MCRIVSVLGCEIEKYLLDNVKKCDKNHKNLWFYLHLFCGAAKKDLIMMLGHCIVILTCLPKTILTL